MALAGEGAGQQVGWGLGGLAVGSDDPYAGPRLELALLPSSRVRLAAGVAAVAGFEGGGGSGVRTEVLGQFHLTPLELEGWGVYGGGGIAHAARAARSGRAYLVVFLGLERSPGGRRSWFIEGGLGGGYRMAVGLRWRPPAAVGR